MVVAYTRTTPRRELGRVHKVGSKLLSEVVKYAQSLISVSKLLPNVVSFDFPMNSLKLNHLGGNSPSFSYIFLILPGYVNRWTGLRVGQSYQLMRPG
jgi:hypothetical protein